jgi:hypothetical protein
MAVTGFAHGADMYRAWANAVIRGQFAPIPRLYAAGAAYLPGQGTGTTVVGVQGWDDLRAQLGELVVDVKMPAAGPRAASSPVEPYVVVRHRETAVVDDALRRVMADVRVEYR